MKEEEVDQSLEDGGVGTGGAMQTYEQAIAKSPQPRVFVPAVFAVERLFCYTVTRVDELPDRRQRREGRGGGQLGELDRPPQAAISTLWMFSFATAAKVCTSCSASFQMPRTSAAVARSAALSGAARLSTTEEESRIASL